MIHLSDYLRDHLSGSDPFDAVLALHGETYREHKHRRTFRCRIGNRDFFVKIHGHTGWWEILKHVLRGRLPTLTARPEWRAIQRCERLGVRTVSAVGFGVRGRNPARMQSFVITEALEDMIHLDELASDWCGTTGAARRRLQRAAISELAGIARALHRNGMNHRDFYLCHFMLPQRDFQRFNAGDALGLHLIDLHRVQIRAKTPARWIAKDLSGLLFSALDAGISGRDGLRFLRTYWGETWRQRLRTHRRFLRRVIRRAVRLYRSEHGRSPALPASLASF